MRALGRLLGVPEQFIARHPFPGPGLAVRIIGDVTGERAAGVGGTRDRRGATKHDSSKLGG